MSQPPSTRTLVSSTAAIEGTPAVKPRREYTNSPAVRAARRARTYTSMTAEQRAAKLSGRASRRAADQRAIVAHLAEHGARWGERIANDLGLSLDRFWTAIYGSGGCGWFVIGRGGWGLSAAGRAAADAMGEGRDPGKPAARGRRRGRPRKKAAGQAAA